MTDVAIHVDQVWKKFRKGELHDSLRELIPAMAKKLIGRGPKKGDLADREFWAIKDVSFEVKRGQSLGIIGPNGAGKSTMLKLLSRIIKPNRGSYQVNGRLSALIEVGAGFHQDLTGRENIYLNGIILGMTRKEIRAREEQIIDFAGVEEFIDTPVKRYSSGMKARLGFAVAAHMEPDVLLVDEVLSVGDARFRAKCIKHMHELIASDVTVVFISHLLEQVRALCPNTIVLDHGQLVYSGDTDGAIRKYLDVLGSDNTNKGATQSTEVEVKQIQICDALGHEVLEWQARQPGVVQCELILHQRIEQATVQINFSTLGGVYLGTANTKQSLALPAEPGRYRLRFTFDPMPLADGNYSVELKVHDSQTRRCVWAMPEPRVVSVIGSGIVGGSLLCDGAWDVQEAAVATRA